MPTADTRPHTARETVNTTWEVRTYDVWGNARDGYEVNDSFTVHREYPLTLAVEVNNPGQPGEFRSAYPTDRQLRAVFGVNCRLDTDGDDTTVYVNRARDGYPLGELHCTSHDSLSPIRGKSEETDGRTPCAQ